jgi:GT2 family glycosyltransferase
LKPAAFTPSEPAPTDASEPAGDSRPPPGEAPRATAPVARPPDLTVSIVSHGQAALVDRLLRQIARQTATGLIRRVVVTLNIPEPVPADWTTLAAFPVDILRNRAPAGFAANHNRALEGCADGLVAILNPDLDLQGDPLTLLAQAARAAGTGLVAPLVLQDDGQPADAARSLLTPGSVIARLLPGRRRASTAPHWYAGMCLVLPAGVWRAVGGFDARYRLYCEDFDLCARLRLAGWALVQQPQARVRHAAQRSSHRSLRPLAWHLRSLARVWRSPVYRDYRRLLRAEAAPSAGTKG